MAEAKSKPDSNATMVGPALPPAMEASRSALKEMPTAQAPLIIYQLAGGEVQAHVVVIEGGNPTEGVLRQHSKSFHRHFVQQGWTVAPLCIYTFICMSAEMTTRHYIYTADSKKTERFESIIDDPLETNRIVGKLIHQNDGMIVRIIIAHGRRKGEFAYSSLLQKAAIAHLGNLIQTANRA
jgi:hypothetical protein